MNKPKKSSLVFYYTLEMWQIHVETEIDVMIPVFFCCFVVFGFWLHYKMNHSENTYAKQNEDFWKREQEANFIPKKDISGLDYIHVPLEEFPFHDNTTDEKLQDLQDKVKKDAQKTLLNLTGMSNTDIKYAYGSGNYPVLAEYDQNFTVFIRDLYAWGKYLYECDFTREAILLLEFGISCHSDIMGNYTLLGKIYLDEDNLEAFNQLIALCDKIPGSRKDAIKKQLTTMLREYT